MRKSTAFLARKIFNSISPHVYHIFLYGVCLAVTFCHSQAAQAITNELVLKGTWPGYERGRPAAVAVAGNYAYVAAGSGSLMVMDISSRAEPKYVGGYETSAKANGVAVSGNHVYLANAEAGLQIIDVSEPSAPRRVGRYDTSGSAMGVTVVGKYAYVADWEAGVQIIDVSNPASPKRVGGYNTPGNAYDVAVMGNYAYVADGPNGLVILDVSNPAAPRFTGWFFEGILPPLPPSYPSVQAVALAGNYAYLADQANSLRVVDVSDPAAPKPERFRLKKQCTVCWLG